MITRVKVAAFVASARRHPVLDVRSPGEYQNGHIPQAISFPLFDNNERAEIGTLYKQAGQLEAMTRGMDLIGPKVGRMFAEGVAAARDGQLLVHCWRGGKRSEAVAGLLAVAGIKVAVLDGGYKQFRNWALEQFTKPWPLAIIGGMTGSGKTAVLHAVAQSGANTIDLEQLADHKGSAFGRIGATRDVSFTQFENDLAWQLDAQAPGTIWLEDESRTIGSLHIPNAFWESMTQAPVYMIQIPRQVRMDRLMQDYGQYPVALLRASIVRIQKRLGGLRTTETLQALDSGDAYKVMDILLDYYDRAYLHSMKDRSPALLHQLEFDHFDPQEIAHALQKAHAPART